VRQEEYDLLNRLVWQAEPDGSWLRYQYDERGALASVEHSSGESVEYDFFPERFEWRARSAGCETVIRFSPKGLPEEVAVSTHGPRWTVGYRHARHGAVTSCRYPCGSWLEMAETPQGNHSYRVGIREYGILTADGEGTTTRLTLANGAFTEETIDRFEAGEKTPLHRLRRITVRDGAGVEHIRADYAYDAQGRVRRAGDETYVYDTIGRLAGLRGEDHTAEYRYDGYGRLKAKNGAVMEYGPGPNVAALERDGKRSSFEYDALGRRIALHDTQGTTRYQYNLFNQLHEVIFPDGSRVEYLYDGFGRLIGRKGETEVRFYAVGFDNNRLAELDGSATVLWSYLWEGAQCIGRVAGPLGGELDSSYHRLHGGRLAAVGDAGGRMTLLAEADAFGAESMADEHCPAFASLFGDRETGLFYAGHRWLDPATAQFLTPDSWFGAEPDRVLPPHLRMVLGRLPGGTARLLNPVTAYCWCAYDPVNFIDRNGHNWLGLIFSTLSALLWEAQLNGLALELHVINIIIDILQLIIFREVWDTDGYWLTSVWHFAPPVASYRLMVPLGLILNGISTRDGRAWALGNVIFSRTKDLTDIEEAAKRDLLVCDNASDYVAFANEAAAGSLLARNPLTQLSGTIGAIGAAGPPATGGTITGVAVATPAGGSLAGVIKVNDFISIRLAGAGVDEVRSVASLTGAAQINLNSPPLPAIYSGQPVELARLDQSVLRIEKDSNRIARAVRFIRGKAIHYGVQIPDGFPTDGLAVAEYLQAGVKKTANNVAFPAELILLRMSQAADIMGYTPGDFIRILIAGAFTARKVEGTQPDADLLIDAPLPGTTGLTGLQVVKMNLSGAAVGGQATPSDSSGNPIADRVTVTAMTDLRKFDSLTITDATATPTVLRRIVSDLFLDCTVDPLPATLQNTIMQMERLGPDTSVEATAKIQGGSGTQIQNDPGQTAVFQTAQAVRVRRQSDGLEGFGVIASVTAAGLLTLDDPLPVAQFGDGTDVVVTLLTSAGSAAIALSGAPPASHVVATVVLPTDFSANDLVRVRLAVNPGGGVVRTLVVAPVLTAKVDTALPNTHFTNVTVQRFVADPATERNDVSAPLLQQRLIIPGANPFVTGDQLYINGTEQGWGQVDRIDGANVFLTSPITQPMGGTVSVMAIGPSGVTTADGKLDDGRVLIPSDPGEEPLTRRGAVQNHEMRHVWQGAVWGPFLLSLPIPWLVNLGFSFSRFANTSSKVFRYASAGGLDSIIALLIWGIGSRKSATEIQGTLTGAGRKSVQLAADTASEKLAKFESGSQVEVTLNEVQSYNLVDAVDGGAKSLRLRFSVGDGATPADAPVRVSVSPFENIRRKVSRICSVNLETLWHDHIPTAWGRALSAVAQRDSWLPPFGIYPMSLLAAGGDQERLPNEQDAAYHSGDLYTDISTSDPDTVFVGQFSKLFAFIQARYGGLSSRNPANILTVALPAGVQATDIAGGVPAGTVSLPVDSSGTVIPASDVLSTFPLGADQVRFRENYFVQLSDKIENAVGVFFAAAKPGIYTVIPPDKILIAKGLVFKFAFDVDFVDLARLTVNDIGVTPDPAAQYFETQEIRFTITGDGSAQYGLRFPPGSAGNIGAINGLVYTAPVLAAGAAVTQAIEVTATYGEDHPVFTTPGQSAKSRLTAEQRTNLCRQITMNLNPLTVPALGPVIAGVTADFTMPIAPNGNPTVTSLLPAGAAVNARVLNLGGTPAQLRFFAPDAVTAPANVTFDMVFGADPANRKTITVTVVVNPAP
jgi:YD repeat-containing protein